MKRLLLHLIIPALVAAWAVVSTLRFEVFSLGMFATVGILGFLYYSAPHLLWALVAALSKTSSTICHAGFIAANVALLAIVSVPFFGVRDPSGLPLQWVAYWPFALVLQALFVAATAAVRASSSRVGA
jgi:hypothetical protein